VRKFDTEEELWRGLNPLPLENLQIGGRLSRIYVSAAVGKLGRK